MSNGLIQVVAGINVKYINNIPFVLLGLKPSGIWEFPGGKVIGDESHREAMEREWIEELDVMVFMDEKRFGHARNGAYEVWFYEVEVDEYDNIEPMAKEHVDVSYFRLDEVDGIEMNQINKSMLTKLIAKYK
jgi:8-oxo-dGTP pyrophosphatase MutT (NUDIX family)